MFENSGNKIKVIAKVMFYIDVIVSIIAAIVYFVLSGITESASEVRLYIVLGFSILIAGPVISWIINVFIYGYGELIDKTCKIDQKLSSKQTVEKVEEIEEIIAVEESDEKPYIPFDDFDTPTNQ